MWFLLSTGCLRDSLRQHGSGTRHCLVSLHSALDAPTLSSLRLPISRYTAVYAIMITRRSTSRKSTTGRKHAGRGEVQKISIQWIFCLFILCYLPYICTDAVRRFVGHTIFIQCIIEFTITIAYLNSCLNPILYCLRHPAIRASVLQTLHKVCARCFQQ